MKTSKPNILIVTSEFPPQPGGIGNHAYNLALHFSYNGYKVRVIADQRSKSGVEENDFDSSLPFSVNRISLCKLRFIMYVKRILFTLKYSRRATHCIATGKFSLWNVAFSNFFFKSKTLAIVHGTEVNFKSLIIRNAIDFSLKRFETIVAVSNYTKGLISHLNREVIVIPNGISTSKWINSTEKLKLKGDPVLTTVGRVSSRKGQLNVIKHLPELKKQFPELHYHCVGIPTEADGFISVAKNLNVDAYITFHGSVDAAKLKQILAATDIFVMLSSESRTGDVEGFGIAILEANAMGIPAIGAKSCGIEDAINSGHSGQLIDLNDTNAFRLAILQILQHTSEYKIEAKKWAEQHDWSHIIKHYIALLQ
jgi:phosphatidylinositol alpha-1,6-mannosyltransferase